MLQACRRFVFSKRRKANLLRASVLGIAFAAEQLPTQLTEGPLKKAGFHRDGNKKMNSEEAIVAEDTDQQVKVPLRRSTRERRTVRKPIYFSEEQYSSTQNGTRKQHGDAESSSISKEIAGEEGTAS